MTLQSTALIETIRNNIIGADSILETPFGRKPLIYADYTASGRSLAFIEDYIRDTVLPLYANTHTETSATGRHTTQLREQARQAIRTSVGATDRHAVIFTGSGATSAINKVRDLLQLRQPQQSSTDGAVPKPVVFIGPYEHHSNELPWRESCAEVITIPLTDTGEIDCNVLKQQLAHYSDRPVKIGSFSAASNVTGIISDIQRITSMLKTAGALAFWDFAACAPYVTIDIEKLGADGIFISPHKFIGGPGTPGILVVNKSLLEKTIPTQPGGGTVQYVTAKNHHYVDNGERREESGTPAIIESIRAGLAFQLKDKVGIDVIHQHEQRYLQQALASWQKLSNLKILGNTEADRLAIVALQLFCPQTHKQLHYGFVVALLNDLFGIQARGGCSCAGPYAHSLLNLDEHISNAYADAIAKGYSIIRPGWTRLNFNYFIGDAEANYLIEAVSMVAKWGYKLLPFYQFCPQKGVWTYREAEAQKKAAFGLDDPNYLTFAKSLTTPSQPQPLQQYLDSATALLQSLPEPVLSSQDISVEMAPLVWFA